MRVVVVGATGNAGTALLRALVAEPKVTSVVGVARRLPDRTAEPYKDAEWVVADVASYQPDGPATARLAEAFEGADAVVHLAWLIQPNRERELLRRTNVDGTRRVAEAVLRAGVPHLVVASSIGAYSRVEDDEPRTEDWPTDGIPTSHYAVDKAAQERVLDEVERAHPGLTVTRVRPGLVFQGDAAQEIVRYFLGPAVPVRLLTQGRPPFLPLPRGLRVQAVHADDLADAYRRIVLERAGGAFNVAADDLLRGQDLAHIVDHGRLVELPPPAVRAALALAYQARAVRPDPGWVDMAMSVPVMDTRRIRDELGWRPAHTAAAAVQELLAAMGRGSGQRTAPLRPALPRPAGDAVMQVRRLRDTPGIPPDIDRDLLGLYLSDHLTGATAGLQRLERMSQTYEEVPFQAELAELVEQLRAEREMYRDMLGLLGVRRRPYRQAAAWVGERVGRLKLNGRALEGSPMTAVLETELMRAAVLGKIGGWQTLEEHAEQLGLDPAQFRELIDLARSQIEVLDRVHAHVRAAAFRADAEHGGGEGRSEQLSQDAGASGTDA
ncbi:epimerase [Xylanimonas oleitrophica]|uniref:Epimerase n=1 Tax=Xylanimonas oleitrophica TaxID=2607479 RepID=A0A2W5WQD0_9MICO|nr:NAD-dependent epimerase/dehydratase family protein [Xylanimonas oleitrophica]PZR52893.1 epimerase [Xylanimonas oleitrophica]